MTGISAIANPERIGNGCMIYRESGWKLRDTSIKDPDGLQNNIPTQNVETVFAAPDQDAD